MKQKCVQPDSTSMLLSYKHTFLSFQQIILLKGKNAAQTP